MILATVNREAAAAGCNPLVDNLAVSKTLIDVLDPTTLTRGAPAASLIAGAPRASAHCALKAVLVPARAP